MKVSVVVTVLNEERTIQKLLDALGNQTKLANEVIIVDGGSTDETLLAISNFKNRLLKSKIRLKVFTKKGNRSVGRNYGIQRAKGVVVAVTDAGCYPKNDWLERIITPFRDQKIGLVNGYYTAFTKTAFEKCVAPYFLIMPDRVAKNITFLASSRSVAFRKAVWKKAGGYPEQFAHNEDMVFDYNLKRMGIVFCFEPRAVVYWYPPENIWIATRQFFRFAIGDAQAGIKRPKIKFIFWRYSFATLLALFGFYIQSSYIYQLLFLFFLLYVAWAIYKNIRYTKVPQAIFWLPVLQVSSDLAVMGGTLVGIGTRIGLFVVKS